MKLMESSTSLNDLEAICIRKGILLIFEEMDTDYFIYHSMRRQVILSPSAQEKHIDLIVEFLNK